MFRKPSLGILITIIIVIIPSTLWLLFSNNHNDALIRLSGLCGLSLLAWNIILSSRLHILDRLFKGLDRLYLFHQTLAAWIVSLLTIHFTLLVLKYASISLISGYNFIVPDLNLAYSAGRLGLFILLIFTICTLYFKIEYRWFVLSMRIMGFVIFLGSYHALFVPDSDLKKNIPLLIYLVILTTTAMIIYIYRSLFHKSLNKKYLYEVSSIDVKRNISEITLKPIGNKVHHYSG